MNKSFDSVDERVLRFNKYLDKLYYAGRLKLAELHAFRGLLGDIDMMFKKLKMLSVFGIVPRYVKRDMDRLDTELTLMEYNVSLISTGLLSAA